MELRQLKYFIRSAEVLNFTEAANDLFISQSTLSQQIKQLEDELGILLFDRVGKRIRITEAGNLFLTYARQALQDTKDGKQIIEDLKELKTGTLNIGVTYGLSALLTDTIVSFSKLYPQIKITVDFGTSEDLLEKLKIAKIDFVLSFLQLPADDVFVSQVLFDSKLALVVHPSHPVAKEKTIDVKDLQNISLALPAKGFNTRDFLEDAFSKNNINPLVKVELNDINMLLQLVETGNWCTILTMASVKGRPGLQTIPITGIDITREASITWYKDVYRKKAALAFAELIRSQIH
ncbi:HTH-type transcriptional regulator CynR [mine drainage metagenome]|uniref:HTH-type transcriptional regulator CynR n=1 Tax=mine drainage metagenome TaxID=410659 RepID=A0A1J5T7D3_9ZZZZ